MTRTIIKAMGALGVLFGLTGIGLTVRKVYKDVSRNIGKNKSDGTPLSAPDGLSQPLDEIARQTERPTECPVCGTRIDKYGSNGTEHGYIFEDMVYYYAKRRGWSVTRTTEYKDGPDLIINGQPSQMKCCATMNAYRHSLFKDGEYRYAGQIIWVPKDHIKEVRQLLYDKDVTATVMALPKKYNYIRRVAQPLTWESLSYDFQAATRGYCRFLKPATKVMMLYENCIIRCDLKNGNPIINPKKKVREWLAIHGFLYTGWTLFYTSVAQESRL